MTPYVPRLCTTFILLLIFSLRALAAEGEADLLKAATGAFNDKFYSRAEEQFAEFATKFPSSTNLPQAILYQAQARHFQKEHDAAIELLRTNSANAGGLADQYVFTWADALGTKGEHAAAAEQYGRLLKEFPSSPLRLQAAYLQAFSYFQLKDYARTIELLRNPESDFPKLAAANPQDRFTFAGGLLLVDTLLATGKLDDARAVATALVPPPDRPDLQWERHDALARIEFTSATPLAALPHFTNALTVAEAAQLPRLQAQSWNLAAEAYKKVGQTNGAIAAYEKIAAMDSLPIDQRRLAMLKTVELFSLSGNLTNAIGRLESYLAGTTNEPAADLLRVKAGDLWIDHARNLARQGNSGPAVGAATNALAQARAHLTAVINQFTNSSHLGRAWLNLGWAAWEEGSLFERTASFQESAAAFRAASEKLTRSDDHAMAVYKLADAQFYLEDFRAAATNYSSVLANYIDLPQVKNALFDKTYAQLVRAEIELGDFAAARKYVADLRKEFPNSPLTEETLFFFGQALAETGAAAEARAVFQDLLTNYPSSARAAEARFAEARTYAAEGNYPAALQKHEQWLAAFTNHVLLPEVEFQRCVLLDKAQQSTNALAVFTQFVARYPTNPLAPAAQMWIANYYDNRQQPALAEQNYQRVFQNTNWAGVPLAYQARMNAARAAFRRGGYDDARSYLTNLVNDPRCPVDLQPEAWFALGDVFMKEPITSSTNAVYNFIQAAAVFDRITSRFASNVIAVLALAKKGDCYFQLGSRTNYPGSYAIATNAYWSVLNSKMPGLPVKVYNQAEFGLAQVLVRMAEGLPAAEREKLLERARDHLLNIVYSENPDPYYLKEAGREAGRLSESLGNTDAAIELYRRLSSKAPSFRTWWQNRITMLESTREQRTILQ